MSTKSLDAIRGAGDRWGSRLTYSLGSTWGRTLHGFGDLLRAPHTSAAAAQL